MTLVGATADSHAVDVQLLGEAASVGRGGYVLLSAGSSAAQGDSVGSVLMDAGTDPAGGSPAEVQVATASVCTLTLMFAVFIFRAVLEIALDCVFVSRKEVMLQSEVVLDSGNHLEPTEL